MTIPTVLGIASIFIGFLCIAGAFASYMYKKPVALSVVLGIAALIFVTVLPVFLAVFFATAPADPRSISG
ncbi:hypothetical protein [Corynebacterium alimapuense]|uniref:Uncharacterized protein n=1 Tax=Corynebacterium alimapuense TaxID=1576874 RepID=A0A3M8K4C5_9CORY|nr:hypothetical protein [Corynebacterium alimapuense]RNE48073.1 hypothetical protein C5L39_09320 [Corynebacterium alimapuense]